MGNTTTNPKRLDRPYSIDVYSGAGATLDRRESPRPDDSKGFDFTSSTSTTTSSASGTRRRPVLCYQNSSDYGNEENCEEFKVIRESDYNHCSAD